MAEIKGQIYINLHNSLEALIGFTILVVGYGIDDLSSNLGLGGCVSLCATALRKDMNLSVPSPNYG